MQMVEATDTVRIGPGTVLRLSKEQAGARTRQLKAKGDDLYETVEIIEFKRGEKFGIDGQIDKVSLASLASGGEPMVKKPDAQTSSKEPVKFVMPKPEDLPIRTAQRAGKKR